MYRWWFFGGFDGLLDFFFSRIHFGLDRTHLRIDAIADVGHGLPERSHDLSEAFTEMLQVIGRYHRCCLRRVGFERSLLRLYAGHGIFVHNGGRTLGGRFCLGTSRQGWI